MSSKISQAKFTPKKLATMFSAYLIAWFFLYPYINMFVSSLKPHDEIYAEQVTHLPKQWMWSNYLNVWKEYPIAGFMKSSLLVSIFATLIVLLVSIPAAYYVARAKFKGRGVFLLLVLATQMFSPTALIIGIFREVKFFNGLNTYIALIIVNAGFNLAFSVWLLSGFFSTVPQEIEESAMIDGCNRLQALRRITLPVALPGIVTAIIFTFVATWNEFTVALTLMSTIDKYPISIGITTFIGQYDIAWEYLFATQIMAIVPVVVLFIAIERYLVGGLTAGSVK
jgi:multiple sugar transport system permease protein